MNIVPLNQQQIEALRKWGNEPGAQVLLSVLAARALLKAGEAGRLLVESLEDPAKRQGAEDVAAESRVATQARALLVELLSGEDGDEEAEYFVVG